MSKNIFWELPLDDILIHKKEGETISVSSGELKLERHLRTNVMKDEFIQMLLDPYINSPKAEEIISEKVNFILFHFVWLHFISFQKKTK